jgi:parallel beta-helix repeat protein
MKKSLIALLFASSLLSAVSHQATAATFTVPESMLLDTGQFTKGWGSASVSRSDAPGASVDFTFTGLDGGGTGVKDDYPVATVYGQTGGPDAGDFSNFTGYMILAENLDDKDISIQNIMNTGFTGASGNPSSDGTNDTFWYCQIRTLAPGETFVLFLNSDAAVAWNITDNKVPHTGGGLNWANGGIYAINSTDRTEVSAIGFEVKDLAGTNPDATIRLTPVTLSLSPTDVFVDDDWVGEPFGKEVYFPGDPNPHYIGIDAFAAIQDGIDGVAGSTVNVAQGTYTGATVDKPVTILGASDGTSVITSGVPYKAGSAYKTAFRLAGELADVNGSEIKNFTVECNQPASFYFAVFSRLADDVTIDSFVINESVQAITNWGGDNWEITNNVLNNSHPSSGGGIGIWLGVMPPGYLSCSHNLIEGNRIITSYSGAVSFTCPAIGIGMDLRWGGYANLTCNEDISNNQILNNIIKDEGHQNQIGVEIGVLGLEGDPVKIAAVIGKIHDNIIKDNTIQDTDTGVYFYNVSTLTVQDNDITNCADNGVYVEGDQNDCTLTNNRFVSNGNYGVDNNTPTVLDAENNWWGDATGPNHPSTNPGGLGDEVSDTVDYNPWLTLDPRTNILKLDAHSDPAYLNPNGAVGPNHLTIDMDALNLAQHVFGCQAVLNFSSAYFISTQTGPGSPLVQPGGGGVWEEMVYNIWNETTGDLDVAVGVDLESVVGTKVDGTVAKFTLTVKPSAPDGSTLMVFRPDVDDIERTIFSDSLSQAVYPGSKIPSQSIVIDGTPPSVTVVSPNGGENLKGGGTCTITWTASDPNIDYDSVMLEYYDGSDWQLIATGENNDGTYSWSLPTLNINNAKVKITVWDLAGNSTSDDSDADFTIDSTAPTIVIASAKQGGQELIGTATNAVQGVVNIQVTASDGLSGLAGSPTVTVTANGGSAEAAAFVNQSPAGTFNYTWSVASTTPNGTATINASVSDNAGNPASAASKTFNINKNQVTGTVELQSLNPPTGGITRTVRFVANGGTKTWDISVSFAAGSPTGSYTLTDVPDGTTALSAKAAWNLRRKLTGLSLDLDGQLTGVNFTGGSKLLGGDINGSNGINILDYSVLKTNWFTTNAVADINGDSMVNLPDYSIMKSNFFQKGDDL